MGLASGSLFLPSLMRDQQAYAAPAPKRLVLFLTDHGPVTGRWQMRRPNLPETSADWEFPLDDPDPTSFGETLAPLHDYRDDLLILDGLSMTSSMADPGYGFNGHQSSITNRLAAQGGVSGPSIDQIIAESPMGQAAFRYLFYTNGSCDCWSGSPIFDTAGNQVNPNRLGGFSFLPNAYDRVFGGLPDPGSDPKPITPEQFSVSRRKETLDLVKNEYTKLFDKLGKDDRDKLTRHRDMIADLQTKIDTLAQISCEKPTYPASGLSDSEVSNITMGEFYPIAMACDLTRVGIYQSGGYSPAEIGAPGTIDVHQDAAHESQVDPASSWMNNYYKNHASEFAKLVAAFKATPEGSGTMLDNSLLLWMPELANGWHDFNKLMVVMAGGAGGAFKTGRYVKYKETNSAPTPNVHDMALGPPHTKLLVSILQAFGVNQNALGIQSSPALNGSTIDLTGPLHNLS
jgi:hypothetical protein